jgi:hypothetical protein
MKRTWPLEGSLLVCLYFLASNLFATGGGSLAGSVSDDA